MATPIQAYNNIRKYGFKKTLQGSLNNPGGWLDNQAGDRQVEAMRAKAAPYGGIGYGDRAIMNFFTGNRTSNLGVGATADGTLETAGPEIPMWQQLGYPDEASYNTALIASQTQTQGGGGYTQPSVAGQVAPQQQQTAPAADVFSAPIGAGTPDYRYFQEAQYDINNPEQRLAFAQARRVALQNEAQNKINLFQESMKAGLTDAAREQARELEDIQLGLSTLDEQEAEARRGFELGVRDTNEKYDVGTVNRQNYFANLSPNAFQSSMGSGQQMANNQRIEGLAEQQRTLGQNQNQIGQARAGLQREQGDLGNAYNQYIEQSQNELGRYSGEVNNFYNSQVDDLRSDFANYDQQAGIKDFRFGREQFQPVGLQTADISSMTPYLNFQSLQGSPEANFFRTNAPKKNALTPRDNYLGYMPDEREKDYAQNYLQRGY